MESYRQFHRSYEHLSAEDRGVIRKWQLAVVASYGALFLAGVATVIANRALSHPPVSLMKAEMTSQEVPNLIARTSIACAANVVSCP